MTNFVLIKLLEKLIKVFDFFIQIFRQQRPHNFNLGVRITHPPVVFELYLHTSPVPIKRILSRKAEYLYICISLLLLLFLTQLLINGFDCICRFKNEHAYLLCYVMLTWLIQGAATTNKFFKQTLIVFIFSLNLLASSSR